MAATVVSLAMTGTGARLATMDQQREVSGWKTWGRRLGRFLVSPLVVLLGLVGGLVALALVFLPIEQFYRAFTGPDIFGHSPVVFPPAQIEPSTRRTADGTTFTVDTHAAVFGLEMRPEDDHARRVFPSYGAAVAYARAQKLPTIPSVPLILAAGHAFEDRLQAAVEHQLEVGAEGRPALLERWLAVVVARRQGGSPAVVRACDRAADYLANAIALGGGSPRLPDGRTVTLSAADDTVLGPWATDPALARIWKRDRALANGIELTDDDEVGVGAAAVLAQALADDQVLAAGWCRQAGVAQAWAGAPAGATIEQVREALRGLTDRDPTSAAVQTAVRAVAARGTPHDGRFRIAPAGVAWATSPEAQVLRRPGASSSGDPVARLIAAVISGELVLTPGENAGFYRRHWFALETLADARRAPEERKLQCSADYVRRWHRAFAAAFTEGRSGMVKRLPVITEGLSGSGHVPVEVAPSFSAEPAPIVYLRLARAYRALATDLAAALGPAWGTLADTRSQHLAAEVDEHATVLFGIALTVYRELGFPPPLTTEEKALDAPAAIQAAGRWLAGYGDDPAVTTDARLLTTLVKNNSVNLCPAVVGIRLEPVRYRWVERPVVSHEVHPTFVPVDYWLASPCPLTATVRTVPTPAEFRARCDTFPTIDQLYAAWGATPLMLVQPRASWWPWMVVGLLVTVLGVALVVVWCRLTWKGRGLALVSTCLALLSFAWWMFESPPVFVARWVLARVVAPSQVLSIVARNTFPLWAGTKEPWLFLDLVTDPDPQVRYISARNLEDPENPLLNNHPYNEEQKAILRRASNDVVPEAALMAWNVRCHTDESTAVLVAETLACTDAFQQTMRLWYLNRQRKNDPEMIPLVLRILQDSDSFRRSQALYACYTWKGCLPQAVGQHLRLMLQDPVLDVRWRVADLFGFVGKEDDLPALLNALPDAEWRMREKVLEAVDRYANKYWCELLPDLKRYRSWSDPMIQDAIKKYVQDPRITLDERISAGGYLSDPKEVRQLSRSLISQMDALPERHPVSDHTPDVRSPIWNREDARGELAKRWLVAEVNHVLTDNRVNGYNGWVLTSHPRLLNAVVALIERDGTPAEARALLESQVTDPKDGDVATALLKEMAGP